MMPTPPSLDAIVARGLKVVMLDKSAIKCCGKLFQTAGAAWSKGSFDESEFPVATRGVLHSLQFINI